MNSTAPGVVDNIPKSVIEWLFTNIQNIYNNGNNNSVNNTDLTRSNPRIIFHDALLALSQFKSIIRPRTRVFINEKGDSKLLLCLYGKILDVPLLIWINENYPIVHPSVYIDMEALSSDYIISVGQYLDDNGKIYLPMFNTWDDKDMNCNIINIVNNLSQLLESNKLDLLIKRDYHSNDKINRNDARKVSETPPLPPKPLNSMSSSSSPAAPHVRITNNTGPIRNMSSETSPPNPTTSLVPPPIPQRPKSIQNVSSTSAVSSPPINRATTQGNTINSSTSSLSSDNNKKNATSPTPLSPNIMDLMDSNNDSNGISDNYRNTMTGLTNLLNQLDINESKNIQNDKVVREQGIKEAIKNFELKLTYESNQLKDIKQQIDMKTDRLNNELNNLNQLESDWKDKFKMANDDDAITGGDDNDIQITETVGLNQIYELVASDSAIDDSVALLYELLNRGTLSLDLFVKKTRDLAKKQFMIRMHIRKLYNLLNKVEA